MPNDGAKYTGLSINTMHASLTVKNKGVTLTEVVVVVAVMAVGLSLILPGIVQVKRRAIGTVDISNLRQIGVASSLYREEFGQFPGSTRFLEMTQLVPKQILYSPIDPEPQGIANYLVKQVTGGEEDTKSRITPYRRTYAGPVDFNTQGFYARHSERGSNQGLFVDLTMSDCHEKWYYCVGTYRRLLQDTSVVVRRHLDPLGPGQYWFVPAGLFADFDQAWYDERRP